MSDFGFRWNNSVSLSSSYRFFFHAISVSYVYVFFSNWYEPISVGLAPLHNQCRYIEHCMCLTAIHSQTVSLIFYCPSFKCGSLSIHSMFFVKLWWSCDQRSVIFIARDNNGHLSIFEQNRSRETICSSTHGFLPLATKPRNRLLSKQKQNWSPLSVGCSLKVATWL